MGEKIIDRFIDEGLVGDPADIFLLEEGDIEVLERFGELSAQNIVSEIKNKKEISLSRFLYALGIPHVGEETARIISETLINDGLFRGAHTSPKVVFSALSTLSKEHLENIGSIGPKIADFVYVWVREKRNKHLLEKLDRVGISITLPQQLIREFSQENPSYLRGLLPLYRANALKNWPEKKEVLCTEAFQKRPIM